VTIVYSVVVALHVVSFAFCAGPVLAITLAGGGISPPAAQRLVRVASFALLALLLTGGYAAGVTGGAFFRTWWLRLSMLLFLVVGALLGGLRRLSRQSDSGSAMRTLGWIITLALALVVYLMEGKPF
jgi:cytochrome bd-type quinol oxidase subunit 2